MPSPSTAQGGTPPSGSSLPCPAHGILLSPFLPVPPDLCLPRVSEGSPVRWAPLLALGGRHWSPASSWQEASSTAAQRPMSARSPSGDARPARPAASPSACGWACSRRVSTGQGPRGEGLGQGLGGSREWAGGQLDSRPASAPWTQPCPAIQGVRLDRVRGGRQKYKRRPEVDPLPFPGPFPAGPLAVTGGPRKTGESTVGPSGSGARLSQGPAGIIMSTGPTSHLRFPKEYLSINFSCVENQVMRVGSGRG